MANRKHFQRRDVSSAASEKSEDKSRKQKFKIDKRGRILIRNLPFKVTEAEVRKHFGKYGKVTEVQLPRRSTGNLVGCGFVQFSNRDKAAKAVADTNGQDFMGRTLDVSFALSKLSYIAARPNDSPLPSITGRQAPADSSAPVVGGGDHSGMGPVKAEPDDGDVKQEPADDASTKKSGEKKKKEKPLQKRGRLIVRNLPFKVTEATLKEHFEAFGEVHDVKLLRRPDGKLVGCGFVQYTWKQNAAKAILKTSGKSFMGRTIIVDWAVPKNVFEARMHEEDEVEVKNEPQDHTVTMKEEVGDDMENAEHRASKQSRKEFRHSTSESSTESDVEFQEDRDETMESDVESVGAERQVRRQTLSNDVVEGCTVFVKNIPFSVTNEQLKECMEQFGQVVYALVCVDPLTEHSKGTGFVKFKSKESAEQCLSAGEEELMLGDQELQALPALPKQEMLDRVQARKESVRGRDARNLYLVKEGVVLAGSKAATGVSAADMARRLQLEQWKTQILRNLNMFVSRTRLVAHNLPSSWDDNKLRQLFAQHSPPGAVIKEARVMRDLRDMDLQGIGRSKEYGFVTFGSHEAALHALRSINNNPTILTPAKRPIVSFSIENKAILNLKQRRLMKSRDKNPLASRTERTGAAGTRCGEEAQGRSQWRETGDVGQGEDSEKFAGVVARPGKVKMRSRFSLRTQAARHSETLRQEKRKRKDQRRATQLRRSVHKNAPEPQVKKKKGKLKGEQKSEEAFSKLVDKYKSKLSTLSAVKKWYE